MGFCFILWHNSAFWSVGAGTGSLDGCEVAFERGDAGDFVLTLVLGASGLPGRDATGAAGCAGDGVMEGFGAGEGDLAVADLGAGDFGVALAGDLGVDLGVALGVSVAGGFTEGAAGEAFGLSFTEIMDFGVATAALGLEISFWGAAFGVTLGEAATLGDAFGVAAFGVAAFGDAGVALALALAGVPASEAVSGTVDAAERRDAEARGDAGGGLKFGETMSASPSSSAAAAFSLGLQLKKHFGRAMGGDSKRSLENPWTPFGLTGSILNILKPHPFTYLSWVLTSSSPSK